MTINDLIKEEIENNAKNIIEIVLDPDVFSKRYFKNLVNKGFQVRWMTEKEQKKEAVCVIEKS